MKTLKTTFSKWNLKNFISIPILTFLFFGMSANAQKIETTLTETWINGGWQNLYKQTNSYDANTYLIHTLSEVWNDPTTAWENSVVSDYTNDSTGKVLENITQTWDRINSIWVNSHRITNMYNGNDKLHTTINEVWNGVTWINQNKQTYSYDSNNYVILNLSENWNLISLSWENSTQSLYSNNSDGTPNTVTDQEWNTTTTAWDNTDRMTYTYSASNKTLSQTAEIWDGTNWINAYLVILNYDVNDYITTQLMQQWNIATSTWDNFYQMIYTNDSQGNIIMALMQIWNATSSIWENSQRITISYLLGIRDFEMANNTFVYPNPAAENFTIKIKEPVPGTTFYLNNQLGQKVSNGTILGEETKVSVNQLPPGLYYLQLGNDAIKTLKIVVK